MFQLWSSWAGVASHYFCFHLLWNNFFLFIPLCVFPVSCYQSSNFHLLLHSNYRIIDFFPFLLFFNHVFKSFQLASGQCLFHMKVHTFNNNNHKYCLIYNSILETPNFLTFTTKEVHLSLWFYGMGKRDLFVDCCRDPHLDWVAK